MILGIIVFILSSLGIYGFFTNNLYFLHIALVAIILEYLIGYFSGQLKKLMPPYFTLIAIFYMICAGFNWLIAISVCLCFENVILFILGIIMMIIVYLRAKKLENQNL